MILRAEAPDHYVAQPLGVPEVKVVAGTAKVVQVAVPIAEPGNPWLDAFGRSANDPDFEEYREELERLRGEETPA